MPPTLFEKKEAARRQRITDRAAKASAKLLSQLKQPVMTPTQYANALKKHDITKVGAAPYFGISRRQAQRIAAEGPVPKLIAKVLTLLNDGRLKKEDLL